MKYAGFTLAEILIVIGIIGVIASMTIPTLIQNIQHQATVSSLKKAYSTISAAYMTSIQENGTPDQWQVPEATIPAASQVVFDKITPYLRMTKNCGTASGCWPTGKYRSINNNELADFNASSSYAKAQLPDGSLVHVLAWPSETVRCDNGTSKDICFLYRIDVNGYKPPNKWGVDMFTFDATKTGIYPEGMAGSSVLLADYTFENYCANTSNTEQGRGCAAWVIYNENMDYLKCPDKLSWDGNHSCPN